MTAHRTPEPSNLQLRIDAFADRMRTALPADADYHHGVTGGHEWAWPAPGGVWAVQVGSILKPGPVLTGPDGCTWRTSSYTLRQADLFVLMLELAGAIPAQQRPSAVVGERGQVYVGVFMEGANAGDGLICHPDGTLTVGNADTQGRPT